jgi:hypothetical protein
MNQERSEEEFIKHLQSHIEAIGKEKERIIKSGKFEEAAALRDTEKKLLMDIQMLKTPRKDHGMRYNDGKLKWSYVHFQSMEPMVRVLMFGAQKYEPHNWQKGLNKVEILESMQRHLAKMMDGEENDPESGLSHIGHIMCNAMFWSYMDLRDKGKINEKD